MGAEGIPILAGLYAVPSGREGNAGSVLLGQYSAGLSADERAAGSCRQVQRVCVPARYPGGNGPGWLWLCGVEGCGERKNPLGKPDSGADLQCGVRGVAGLLQQGIYRQAGGDKRGQCRQQYLCE